MLLCVANGFAVIRTPFDEKYDLIQKFRGLDGESTLYNKPVDFMEAGLMQRDKWDYWHIDIPFALNTDEAVPAFVNGCFIGGNHGHHGAINVFAPLHNKRIADVGSLWRDERGELFTLMRVCDEENLLFLSQNKGESLTEYDFLKEIVGKLVCVDNGKEREEIFPKGQACVDLRRAIRHKMKKVFAYKDGERKLVSGEYICDCAEIWEEYDIINPATVAESLRAARPLGGFERQPDLAEYGEPMISCRIIYRINADGTVLTDFDYKKLSDVRFQRFMGAMYQEKLNVYKGGIFRYYPKILPFTTQEGCFDFSSPLAILDSPFPKYKQLTRECWEKDSLNDRVVDYFRDENGRDRLAFACGFLPIYDGKPEIRKNQVSNLATVVHTRKHYPTFADGDLDGVRGIAYKKYFIPAADKVSYYKVSAAGKTFIYVDFFEGKDLQIPVEGEIELLEKSEGILFERKRQVLFVSGEKGYAIFVEN